MSVIEIKEVSDSKSGPPAQPPIPTEMGGIDSPTDFNDGKTLFKFKTLKERQPGESWVLLYYGPSKAGKTYFAGTCGPRTLFLNTGDGLETLLSPAFTSRYPEAREMITVDIREFNPDTAAQGFDMVGDAIDHAMQYFPDKFDTVVLDEASAFRKLGLNKAVELNSQVAKTAARQGRNRMKDYSPVDVGDYGKEMDMVEWFFATYIPIFKGAGKHFVVLAHERQIFVKPAEIGGEATLKRVLPAFTGKTFPDKVPVFFDDVWHAEVAGGGTNIVYRARTAGNELELGGARHGGIFQTVEPDPNFLKMLKRIQLAQPRSK